MHNENYPINPRALYGPRWRNRRPPGLPEWARYASIRGGGAPYLRHAVEEIRQSREFHVALAALALNETGITLALPANLFNNTTRIAVQGAVSAWGLFGWNIGAWRRLPNAPSNNPWGDRSPISVEHEVKLPLLYYSGLYQQAISIRGMSPAYAGFAIRLWHKGPLFYRQFLRAMARGARFELAASGAVLRGRTRVPGTGEWRDRALDGQEIYRKHVSQMRKVVRQGLL